MRYLFWNAGDLENPHSDPATMADRLISNLHHSDTLEEADCTIEELTQLLIRLVDRVSDAEEAAAVATLLGVDSLADRIAERIANRE